VIVDGHGSGKCLGIMPFLSIPDYTIINPVNPYKTMIRMVANIDMRSFITFDVGRQWNDEKNQWINSHCLVITQEDERVRQVFDRKRKLLQEPTRVRREEQREWLVPREIELE
uniref:Uncharacterized protein n=1 Tax=Amphimedon queenslandica TaxID=400682 RepID=A0A1X7VWC0_AMPQE